LSALQKYIFTCCLCVGTLPATAQLFRDGGSGFNIGLVSALGNRFQRVGLTFQACYCYDFAQVNAEVRLYHNFRNLGPRVGYNELVTSAGIVCGYGEKGAEHNPFMSSIGNQTGYRYSIGYSYNLYFNRVKTSQQTATIALQFGAVSLISENDIFARSTLDRFRTGAFLVQYQYKDLYQVAINCTMWTGQMGNKVTTDTAFPYVGYMDTTGGVYARYSHGLLSAQCKTALTYGQTLQANVGIDAEQVRNFVQNRMMHDMVFIPRKWRRNCHIPALDTAGNQYLYKTGQKIKRPMPYWNLFTGAATFY